MTFSSDGSFVWNGDGKSDKGTYSLDDSVLLFLKDDGKGYCQQMVLKKDKLLLKNTYYKSTSHWRRFKH